MPVTYSEIALTVVCDYCDSSITVNGKTKDAAFLSIRMHGWQTSETSFKNVLCPECRMAKMIIDERFLPAELKPGTQIICIPDHTTPGTFKDIVEYGFVVKVKDSENVWCRYWAKTKDGGELRLRTTANSELTPMRLMRVWSCTESDTIVRACQKWEIELQEGGDTCKA